jgi:hypothetical protein
MASHPGELQLREVADMRTPVIVICALALLAAALCCGTSTTTNPDPFAGYQQVEEWKGIETGMTAAEMFEVLAPQETIERWKNPVNPEFRTVHEFFEDTATGERCIVVIHAYVPEGGNELEDDATILIVEEIWVK